MIACSSIITQFEYVLWCHTMHEWVMDIHCKIWIAQGRFTNIILSPSTQWCVCVIINTHKTPTCPYSNDTSTVLMISGSSFFFKHVICEHYSDVMGPMASSITSLMIVYWTVYSGADQRKHQIPGALVFVRGIRRWPVNSSHKGPVTLKMLPFDDIMMKVWHHDNPYSDASWFWLN